MRKKVNSDPLAPARTREDWEAQGWSSESVSVSVAPRLEATISIRFDPDGALLLRRAARLKGMTKSEFVRQATLQAAQKTVDDTPLPAAMWVSRDQTELAETQSRNITGEARARWLNVRSDVNGRSTRDVVIS